MALPVACPNTPNTLPHRFHRHCSRPCPQASQSHCPAQTLGEWCKARSHYIKWINDKAHEVISRRWHSQRHPELLGNDLLMAQPSFNLSPLAPVCPAWTVDPLYWLHQLHQLHRLYLSCLRLPMSHFKASKRAFSLPAKSTKLINDSFWPCCPAACPIGDAEYWIMLDTMLLSDAANLKVFLASRTSSAVEFSVKPAHTNTYTQKKNAVAWETCLNSIVRTVWASKRVNRKKWFQGSFQRRLPSNPPAQRVVKVDLFDSPAQRKSWNLQKEDGKTVVPCPGNQSRSL